MKRAGVREIDVDILCELYIRIVFNSVTKYAFSIFLGNIQCSWFMFCFPTFNRAMGTENYFFTIKNNIVSAIINVS